MQEGPVRAALLLLFVSIGCELPGGAPPPESTSSRAADYRSESVEQGLDEALRAAQTRGFSAEDDTYRGFVLEGSVEVREVTMAAGSCYAMLGAGSTGVRRLDLTLYLADGSEAARGEGHGRVGALLYCPVHAGTYYVAVRAAAGTGLYGLRLAHGPTGLDVTAADLVPEAAEER